MITDELLDRLVKERKTLYVKENDNDSERISELTSMIQSRISELLNETSKELPVNTNSSANLKEQRRAIKALYQNLITLYRESVQRSNSISKYKKELRGIIKIMEEKENEKRN